MKKLLCLLFIPLIFCQCNKYRDKTVVNRFDKELINVLSNYSDSTALAFKNKYSDFLSIYYSAIMKGNSNVLDNTSKLKFISNCVDNPNFNELYNDVLSKFEDMSSEEYALTKAIKNYSKLFDIPFASAIFTHISPFGYSIITSDSLISVSLDNYMGSDYKGYKGVFYNYQLPKKERSRIIPDIFKGWIYAKFPNSATSLIEGMIYEGAVVYAIDEILDDYNYYEIIGYSKKQNEWCKDNEQIIWDAIIKSNHLYSTENIIYIKYINEAPYCSALNGDVPAEIGKWIGYKIVSKYINKTGYENLTGILNGDIQTIEILKTYR